MRGFSITNHPFFGTPIYGTSHIYPYPIWVNCSIGFTTRPYSLQPRPYFHLWLSLEAAGMARGCHGTMERPKKQLGFWVQDSTFLLHNFNSRVFAHKTCQIPEMTTSSQGFWSSNALRNSGVLSLQLPNSAQTQPIQPLTLQLRLFCDPKNSSSQRRARRTTPSRGSTLG